MNVVARALWLMLAGGSALLVVSSAPYLKPGLRHPFLLERMSVSLDAVWLAVLKTHVACGLVCIVLGLLLLARPIRERWPALHRHLGKAYAAIVLLIMTPTGIYLAPYSKFGWASGSGFIASSTILIPTTVIAIRAAVRGDHRRHRAAALHSYAQIASAISFRVYHLAFQSLDLSYEANYVASVWLSVLGNAAVAELVVRRARERSSYEFSHRREHPVLGVLAER